MDTGALGVIWRAMARGLHIVWFKRDLRVQDHRPLVRAAAYGGSVLPLYIAEPALWAEPDMAARHWAFIAESLAELRADLARLGQPLVVRTGDAVEVLETLRDAHGDVTLHSHEETGNGWTFARDKAVGAWARSHGIPWHEERQSGVIRRLDTRNGWAKRWDAFMAEPQVAPPMLAPLSIDAGPIPTAADLGLSPDPCPERQPGGRTDGLAQLDSFLHVRGKPYRRAMSAPGPGAEHCSRLSPHLAYGTLAMREVAQTLWMRQRALKVEGVRDGWRGSMASFSGRLHWRDHFTQKLEDEPRLEWENLHPAYDGMRTETDAARLAAFAQGETGLPFVDACLRCLNATGWMNFRMRAMLQSVASYHLWLPWRESGLVLARAFTDYEPGIHWSQVQMQSGTTGINTVRIYNPVKQGVDQDPDGTFTRKWLPELGSVPDEHLQAPWAWDGAASVLGRTYPEPLVDPVAAARDARTRIWSVRKGADYRQGAAAIQEKHGSRKSGIPNRGQRASRQLSFDL